MNKELKYNEVWVQVDWESTGLWVRSKLGNYLANASYDFFNLQEDLIKRFNYWTEWYSSRRPEKDDEYNKMDEFLFETYGRSLAIDVKRFLGDDCRVYFGNYEDPIEILLVKPEYGPLVPISKQVHP